MRQILAHYRTLMFEITANDIYALSDEDLRLLVALLCESVARGRHLPTCAVTYGGDQTAKDGGLDVRVTFANTVKIDGFILRPKTGFQVKKPDMGPAAITKEMRPKGKLRPSIKDLAEKKGAYIIVSSGAHLSDSAYKARLAAMRAALKSAKGGKDLAVELYDRTRIATWVRDHGGVTLWVRQRIGKSVRAWRPYEPWAYAPEDLSGAYILDDKLRVKTGVTADGNGLKPDAGLERIRNVLRDPGKIARIVGLSGVGKTRFVQALFDDRIGMNALDPSLAIYTNMADDPDPVPVAMVTDLIATKTKAVVIVDNCPPDLHRRLADICRTPGSTVSVVTVEYDIRADSPEDTEVFELAPASDKLIEHFVRNRFPNVSQIDASTIADFSGGNARIAVALAATVGKGDKLAGLTDADLFKRLFQQRHESDDALMDTAMACSLVYSFDGADVTSGPNAELHRLGVCVQQNVATVFQNVAKLFDRELIQKRSKWRAVLPHALANRLAALALKQIPYSITQTQILGVGAPERMLKSFSRRLGYLHDVPEAVDIVTQWFAPGGMLGDLAALSPLHREVFEHVLPVVPDAGLDAFGRLGQSATGPASLVPFSTSIRLLAWEASKFDRCVDLLIAIAKASGAFDNTNDAANYFKSLFHLWLSGTHATVEQRVAVAKRLLHSSDAQDVKLGEMALDALIEAHHFTSFLAHEFGAHSRDYGYQPKTNKEVEHWYKVVLDLAVDVGNSKLPSVGFARAALAKELRPLWGVAALRPTLTVHAKSLNKTAHWRDGWIGFRQTLRFDFKTKTGKGYKELAALEEMLRPTDTGQRVRAILLTGRTYGLDFEDSEEDGSPAKLGTVSLKLGKEVAANPKAFAALLPELVSSNGQLFEFGRGLVAEASKPKAIWDTLAKAYRKQPAGNRNDLVLRGAVAGIADKDRALATTIVDSLLTDPDLAPLVPTMQMVLGVDAEGVARLKKSLKTGLTPIGAYGYLQMGRAVETTPPKPLRELLSEIAKQKDGPDIAIEILHMRLFNDRENSNPVETDIKASGRELLGIIPFDDKDDRLDHDAAVVVKKCLDDKAGVPVARAMCKRLKASILSYKVNAANFNDMLAALAKVQPLELLNGLLGGPDARKTVRVMHTMRIHRTNLLSGIPEDVLFQWCKQKPKERFPIAANVIAATEPADEDAEKQFTPLALRLIEEAPEPVKVLEVLARRLEPTSWSGSRASILEQNATVLIPLITHKKKIIAKFAQECKARFDEAVARERASELKESRQTDERFE
jgi:hypothetical protein